MHHPGLAASSVRFPAETGLGAWGPRARVWGFGPLCSSWAFAHVFVACRRAGGSLDPGLVLPGLVRRRRVRPSVPRVFLGDWVAGGVFELQGRLLCSRTFGSLKGGNPSSVMNLRILEGLATFNRT